MVDAGQPAVVRSGGPGQRRRLETLGLMAAGLAHDINNLLTVIGNYAAMAAEPRAGSGPPDEADWVRLLADMEHIRNAAARGSVLTGQLLAYARPQVATSTGPADPIDVADPIEVADPIGPADPIEVAVPAVPAAVNTVVEETLTLVRASVGKWIEIVAGLDPDCRAVSIDEGALARILVNLVVNARDAMADGGTITVRTAAPAGHMVLIEVTDTGHGIPEQFADRVFEPFFSTKPVGGGTGLGLAMVHEMVTAAGGRVLIDSTPGGTTVTVRLPAA